MESTDDRFDNDSASEPRGDSISMPDPRGEKFMMSEPRGDWGCERAGRWDSGANRLLRVWWVHTEGARCAPKPPWGVGLALLAVSVLARAPGGCRPDKAASPSQQCAADTGLELL